MKTYHNKHVWIIGASSGIGESLAVELSERGARLTLSARRGDKLFALNERLGGGHDVKPVDVSDFENLASIAEAIRPVDSVIFMAAIYESEQSVQQTIDFIHKTLQVNLGGCFNCVQTILPIMKEQRYGQIALCGSVAGYRGLPNGQPYSATKAAIINYAETLRAELKDENIDIKVINPGFVETPMTGKNKFSMPMILSADKAAKIIASDLLRNRFEIHFPKRLTWGMKILRLLPNWLYFFLVRFIKS
jgi:short-subunit dehydrogenase